MASRANLIATYNANPTLQSQYTLPQYLALFDFSQTTTPTQTSTTTSTQAPATSGLPNIINQNINRINRIDRGGEGLNDDDDDNTSTGSGSLTDALGLGLGFAMRNPFSAVLGLMAKNAIQNAKTTSFGNMFGVGPKGKDAFGNPVNTADVEIGLDTTNITPTNLNDYSGGTGNTGHAGGAAAAAGAAAQAADDEAAGRGGYDDGGRVYLYNRLR